MNVVGDLAIAHDTPRSATPSLMRYPDVVVAALFFPALWLPAAAQTPKPSPKQASIDDLVTANRILATEGVVDGYGHVSVRDPRNPGHYFLSRSLAPGLVTAADIVEYDLDGNPVGGDSRTGYQ